VTEFFHQSNVLVNWLWLYLCR